MIELDIDELRERATSAAQTWAPGCKVEGLETLEGGTVGIVFSAEVIGGPADHQRVVLKVAPPGLPPVRNRDVLRQAHPVVDPNVDSGVPSDAELLSAYEEARGVPTTDLGWFHALTRYKEAAAMALIAKHAARRGDDEILARMADMLPKLIADAHARVS